jgi:hypothetical protein
VVSKLERVNGNLITSSNQRAVQGIARDLVSRPVGDRLDTSLRYQQQLGVGAGTVQKAIRLLESVGAAKLRSAGHQGTFIQDRHVGLLWSLAGLGPVRIASTPPGAIEQYGLAIGLSNEFDRLEVPVNAYYVRGAQKRIDLLTNGELDLAVVSRGAARLLVNSNKWQSVDFGPHSYYSDGSLSVISRVRATTAARKRRLRVAIDPTSPDHVQLTQAEFEPASGYEYVDVAFPTVPAAILEDRIDVGIWHRIELIVRLELMGLQARPLARPGARDLSAQISTAVLTCRSDDLATASLLREIRTDTVFRRQRSWMAGEAGSDELRGMIWAK